MGEKEDGLLKCPVCTKEYKKVKSLRNHIKEKRHFKSASQTDHILNYSKNALSLCYLEKTSLMLEKGEMVKELFVCINSVFCTLSWMVDISTVYRSSTF